MKRDRYPGCVLLFALSVASCAAFKQSARDVNDVARQLCELTAGAQERAEREGISVRELCAIREVVDLFAVEVSAAQSRAADRSGFKRKSRSDGER